MLTKIRIWLQYITIKHRLKVSKTKGYARLETGKIYPSVEKRLFSEGYEQYTQGGILTPKHYYWTTSPVEKTQETPEQED